MNVKSMSEKSNSNKSVKKVSNDLEETMFIGSVFCQDLKEKSKRTSLKNGTSFGINQFWIGNE